jgi:hypothetical protein
MGVLGGAVDKVPYQNTGAEVARAIEVALNNGNGRRPPAQAS